MAVQILLATIDITDLYSINAVSVSERGTNFPFATDTQPTTAHIRLTETEGDFAKQKPQNFFIRNSQNDDGIHCPVEIRDDGDVLFKGRITKCSALPGSAYVNISASDVIEEMRTENITDFGLEKEWKLIEDVNISAENAVYPLTLGVTPVSEDSATVRKALNQNLTIVPELQASGVLNPDNVQITDEAVISEGGKIQAAAGSAYPQMTAKTPYRYARPETVINAILDKLGIATGPGERSIELPPATADTHIETLGRIGYDTVVGEEGSSNHLSWYGYVTDILQDGDETYFAYSPPYKTNALYRPRIIKYNEKTDTRKVFKPLTTAGSEIWSLAKIGNNLICLATHGGKYDAKDSDSNAQLIYFDETVDPISVGTLVARTATLKPQIACFYATGSEYAFTDAYNMLPDTRRRLIVDGTTLYYPYCKTNGEFGIASVAIGGTPTALIPAKDDGYNHAGFAADRDGNETFFGTTFLDATQSTLKVVKK